MATRSDAQESGTGVLHSGWRTLAVLEALAARPGGATPKELSQALGLHLSTVYRLLHTLVAAGYAVRGADSGLFRLGPRVTYLHHGYLAALQPPPEALAFVHALQVATGETAMLNQLEGDDVVATAIVVGSQPEAISPGYVGLAAPAHATAAGRVLLAWLPAAQLAAHIARVVAAPATRPYPLLDPQGLRRELARVCRDGFALDRGEDNPTTCCVAAPIVDDTGQVTTAIAVMAPAARGRRDEAALIAAVRTSAHAISALLPLASPRAALDGVDLAEPEAASPAAIAAGLASLSRAMSRVS